MSDSCTVPIHTLAKIVAAGQCMGCGFCQVPLEDANASGVVTMRWSSREEHWIPEISEKKDSDGPRVCPGAKMDMVSLADGLFRRQPDDSMVGEALAINVGFAVDGETRRESASGGVSTAILAYLFDAGQIDTAYCAIASDGPSASRGALVRSAEALRNAMGSHYHPVNFGSALRELFASAERFAFVGLPCEIAAMRQLMQIREDVSERCVVLVGLFCGGINRYSGIGGYLERFDVTPADVEHIDYRYGEWPGRIQLRTRQGDVREIPRIRGNTRWKILRYMISFQGYWMLPRCRICPDQIADFADIAVGDPHLPRFKSEDSEGYSAIVTRTDRGREILEKAREAGCVKLDPLSRDELVASQGYTLENRRHVDVYERVARFLGFDPPEIRTYQGLAETSTRHQYIYAFVDLAKIKCRHVRWLKPFHLPLQVFEYLFLTFSPRLMLTRIRKLTSNR